LHHGTAGSSNWLLHGPHLSRQEAPSWHSLMQRLLEQQAPGSFLCRLLMMLFVFVFMFMFVRKTRMMVTSAVMNYQERERKETR